MPENRTRVAAAELLRLVAPHGALDAAEAALGDDRLAEIGGDDRLVAEAAMAIAPSEEGGLRPPRGTSPARLVALAIELVRRAQVLGAPMRVVAALARRLPAGSPVERAAAIGDVQAALAPFGDWSGAALLARNAPAGKLGSARQQAERLVAKLEATRAAGLDIYRAAAALEAGEAVP
jgi:hypothetical protein